MSESEAQVCQNTFLWVLICLLHSLGLFLNSCTTESAAFLLRDVMKGQKMKLKRWQVITHTVEENSFQKWQFKYTQRCRKIFFPYLNNMVPFYMVTYFHPSKNKEIPTCQKQIIAAVRAFCLCQSLLPLMSSHQMHSTLQCKTPPEPSTFMWFALE